MIPASSDWITVQLDEQAQRAADGWSDYRLYRRSPRAGENSLKWFAIMWRAREMPRGDLGLG